MQATVACLSGWHWLSEPNNEIDFIVAYAPKSHFKRSVKRDKMKDARLELKKAGIGCIVSAVLFLPALPVVFLLRSRFAESLAGADPVPVEMVRRIVTSFTTITLALVCVFCAIMSLTAYTILNHLKQNGD